MRRSLQAVDIHNIYRVLVYPFRRRRMQAFAHRFGLTTRTTVLDLGGTPFNWELIDAKPTVTMLNLRLPADVLADACCLPFRDKSFEVVFSNAVIEHLFTRRNQEAFAREVGRVGVRFFIVTPNKWFPLELHYLTPFVQFAPKRWRARFTRNLTLWGVITRPTKEECEQRSAEIRLLGPRDMRELFPGAVLRRERLVGVTKSLVAEKV